MFQKSVLLNVVLDSNVSYCHIYKLKWLFSNQLRYSALSGLVHLSYEQFTKPWELIMEFQAL